MEFNMFKENHYLSMRSQKSLREKKLVPPASGLYPILPVVYVVAS